MSDNIEVTITGPLFETDVAGRVSDVLTQAVSDLTDLGEQRLLSAFPQGLPVKSGNLAGHVTPMKQGFRASLDDGGVIYSHWIEGTGSRNATTRFKGYSTWRRAQQYLEEEALPDVAARAGEQLARELGG